MPSLSMSSNVAYFYLIADRALHRQGLPDQLLAGVFGEAGTGKTQVIKARPGSRD